jgi:hypothetical protein
MRVAVEEATPYRSQDRSRLCHAYLPSGLGLGVACEHRS